jgi:hypothetical protein
MNIFTYFTFTLYYDCSFHSNPVVDHRSSHTYIYTDKLLQTLRLITAASFHSNCYRTIVANGYRSGSVGGISILSMPVAGTIIFLFFPLLFSHIRPTHNTPRTRYITNNSKDMRILISHCQRPALPFALFPSRRLWRSRSHQVRWRSCTLIPAEWASRTPVTHNK